MAVYSRDYRVYAVDLPGEPGKSAPVYLDWNGAAWSDWLGEVLDALNIRQATLGGISQGAFTALKFATAHPERVTALALITPGGVVPDRASFIARAIFWSLFGERGTRRIVRLMFGQQSVPAGVEDIVVKISRAFRPRLGLLPLFTDDDLRRLTMPVLMMGGTHDVLRDNPKIAARLRQFVSDLTVHIVPGGGHALLNTAGEVQAFLQANAAVLT
jgi:pimeloyl-ACP methyl ester carboxylesterase